MNEINNTADIWYQALVAAIGDRQSNLSTNTR